MNNNKNLLSNTEFLYFLIGTIIGIGIFQLPYDIVKEIWQDGWISTMFGAIYPLYIIIISTYIIKKFPNDNLFTIGEKYFGKTLGKILNFCFLIEFILVISFVTSGFTNIIRVYVVGFLPPLNIVIVIIFTAMYSASSGLKNLGRMGMLTFSLLILLLSASLMAIKDGSILNVKPVMQQGLFQTIKASKISLTQYSGIECLLLIYPYIKDKKSILKTSLKSLIHITIIYGWVVFITIYYLGPRIVVKSLWPFSLAVESLDIPVINNFRFVFIFLWTLVIIKTIANHYFIIALGGNYLTKIDKNKIILLLSPLMIYISIIYQNEITRRTFNGLILPYAIGFNVLYITIIAIITLLKKNNDFSKNKM